MVPLQRWSRHCSELAVEHGLLVLGHHLVLGSDHWPRKTLICKRQTNICMVTSAGFRPSSSICVELTCELSCPTSGFIKSCQQQHEAGEQAAFRWQCVSTPQGPQGDLMRSVNRPWSLSGPLYPFYLLDRTITHRRSSLTLFQATGVRTQVGFTTMETRKLVAGWSIWHIM